MEDLTWQKRLRRQARALGIDKAGASFVSDRDCAVSISEAYNVLAAEVKAELNTRFIFGREQISGPITLTAEDMDYLLTVDGPMEGII